MIDQAALTQIMEALDQYKGVPLFTMSAEMAVKLSSLLAQSVSRQSLPRKLRKCQMRKIYKRSRHEQRRYR